MPNFRDYSAAVDATQLLELAARCKGVADGRSIRREIGTENRKVTTMLVEAAISKAEGTSRQAAAVAEDRRAFDGIASPDRAGIQLKSVADTTDKSGLDRKDPRRWAFGSEFGAKQNIERTVGVNVTRHPIIFGAPGSKQRFLKEYDYTNSREMLGWNQFMPWRGSGNAPVEGVEPGYWMFEAVREMAPVITREYGEATSRIVARALDNPRLSHLL